jgi:hypothetical protein
MALEPASSGVWLWGLPEDGPQPSVFAMGRHFPGFRDFSMALHFSDVAEATKMILTLFF